MLISPPGPAEGGAEGWLVGRQSECTKMFAALDTARQGRAARLWLTGVPGSGKTALCQWATRQADGFASMAVTCVEGEGALALSGLLSVLRPLRRFVNDIPSGYRATLEALLEGQPTQGLDAFAVGASALALLGRAAEETPVLVCVDDAHWLDEASRLALGFAFRRLDADAVAVMVASRSEASSMGLDSVTQSVEVNGLAAEDGTLLLERVGPFAPGVAAKLVAATGGLPLALTEMAAQLTQAQRSGREHLPDPLPVGGRVLGRFQERFARLDYRCRLAVAVAAAAGAEATAIPLAVSLLGLDDGSAGESLLEDAEEAGLIAVDSHGVTFGHPLVRSAALGVLSVSDRRRVHAALAEVSADPERRAAHLVLSAAGVSAELADALDTAATEIGRRLGSLGAAGIWRDAALLSPQGPARLARLRRAVAELAAAGSVEDALRLADEVLATSDDPVARAEVTMVATWIQMYTERAIAAANDAAAEAALIEQDSPELAQQLRMVAAIGLMTNGPIERSLALADPGQPKADISALGPTLESTYAPVTLGLAGRVAEANVWLPPERVDLCAEVTRSREFGMHVAVGVQLMALALLWLERWPEAGRIAMGAIERLRVSRQPHDLPVFCAAFGEACFWQGKWDEATAVYEDCLSLAEQTGQTGLLAIGRANSARLFALRGDLERCRTNSNFALNYAESIPIGPTEVWARHGLGLGCLLAGDHEEAVAHLTAIVPVAARHGLGNPVTVPFRGDLCEALVCAGDLQRARAERAVLAAQAEQTGLRWPAAVNSRVAAMIADAAQPENAAGEAGSDALFRAALARWPDGFEGARTGLCWAESLVKRGRKDEARSILAGAASEFARLGARPFLERAHAALALTGEPLPSPSPGPFAALTGAEVQVAFAVADGLSNRDIAARLFISPKTVEHHLTHVYQKLNARSRTDLARLVLTDRASAPAPSR
jgi:DNA-binding CsgD family transcriptional regulator